MLALVFPVALWVLDIVVRAVLDGRARGWASLALRTAAAPALLVVGYPFATSSERPIGILLSIPLWLLIGFCAARVATRNPVAVFADYWRAYRWLAVAVFAGVAVALIGASLFLGRSLITG